MIDIFNEDKGKRERYKHSNDESGFVDRRPNRVRVTISRGYGGKKRNVSFIYFFRYQQKKRYLYITKIRSGRIIRDGRFTGRRTCEKYGGRSKPR